MTLLEIKGALNDTKNALSNWIDTDETPCKWTGISCNSQDQRVTSMYASPFTQLNLFSMYKL